MVDHELVRSNRLELSVVLTLWVAAGAVPKVEAAPPAVYFERACLRVV